MKASNIFGIAYHFIPRDLDKRSTEAEIVRGENIITQNNVIYLMTGTMPETDALYSVNNTTEFEATFGGSKLTKFTAQEFTYLYDRAKKVRTIKKTPNAIDFTHEIDGAVTWFAVKLTDVDGAKFAADGTTPEETFIFGDSIGTWTSTERALVVEGTDSRTAGTANIFKDFVLVIQDKITEDLV